MPYQDTFFSTTFQILIPELGAPPGAPGTPMDLTGATFALWISALEADGSPAPTPLLQLSTAAGQGLTVLNAIQGLLRMVLTKAQTTTLPVGTLAFDCMRTDQPDPVSGNPEPQHYFSGFLYVKEPSTKL